MDVLGTHKVSWDFVRRLAVECHALDSSAFPLLSDSILDDKVGKNRSAYEELFTERLLALAIALRTKFYQGVNSAETARYSLDCGLLYRLEGEVEQGPVEFTLKDVCDKIIHADSIHKSVESAYEAEITTLQGTEQHRGKKVTWRLVLSVTLFTECVLNWVVKNEV
ncbi:MAG: hypothetical protein M0003_01300 [Acidithiobacillus sp.]|nr:hypothetical protein [Acidithiobacillus sp.]